VPTGQILEEQHSIRKQAENSIRSTGTKNERTGKQANLVKWKDIKLFTLTPLGNTEIKGLVVQ